MSARRVTVDNQLPDSLEAGVLAGEVAGHLNLHEVLNWTNSREPPLHDVQVVTQDEYTHDVVVKVAEDLYLVYDAT